MSARKGYPDVPADRIKSLLSSAECEAIAERFVDLMGAQDRGRAEPEQTVANLCELFRDAEAWVSERTTQQKAVSA